MDVQRLQILLVSKVPSDLSDLRGRLAETGAGADVHVCEDAPEALLFVKGLGAFDGAARPDVILLDLDVGDTTTPLALLEGLRADPELERIAVIAIVDDDSPEQMEAIADYRIHDTVLRPLDGDTLRRVVAYFNEV